MGLGLLPAIKNSIYVFNVRTGVGAIIRATVVRAVPINHHIGACLTKLVHSRSSIFIFRSPLVLRMSFTHFRANHEMARRNRSIRRSEKPARELCETSS